jgi:hypothetical protein
MATITFKNLAGAPAKPDAIVSSLKRYTVRILLNRQGVPCPNLMKPLGGARQRSLFVTAEQVQLLITGIKICLSSVPKGANLRPNSTELFPLIKFTLPAEASPAPRFQEFRRMSSAVPNFKCFPIFKCWRLVFSTSRTQYLAALPALACNDIF